MTMLGEDAFRQTGRRAAGGGMQVGEIEVRKVQQNDGKKMGVGNDFLVGGREKTHFLSQRIREEEGAAG